MTELKVTKVIKLLKENRFEFAWSPTNMLGLAPSVAIHKLNIDPNAKRIVQKKRVLIPDRQKAIVEYMEKLRATGFI